MSLHICLISDQLLANYLPIKQLCPQKVLMINTSYTRKKGLDKRFARMVAKLGVECIDYPEDVPDENYEQMQAYFSGFYDFFMGLDETDITLNLTGGNKLMTLAAYGKLRQECTELIYTNTAKGTIELIGSTDSSLIKLESRLTVDEYLAAYGAELGGHNSASEQWQQDLKARRKITAELAKFANTPNKSGFISKLNVCCAKALKNQLQPNQEYRSILVEPTQVMYGLTHAEREFLLECENYRLLSFNPAKSEVTFLNPEDTLYLGGMWLEELTYQVATSLGLEDVRSGQQIRLDNKVKNELDMVIVHNNKMLVIECKTIRFQNNDASDTDILYKLDSVADDLKGLFGATWLISARKIENQQVLDRANRLGIQVIHGDAIADLRKELEKWANA